MPASPGTLAPVRRLPLLLIAVVFLLVAPARAQEELPPGGTFYDDQDSVHEAAIEGLAAAGITRGCHDEKPIYCPDRGVTRGEMAAFLDRALSFPATGETYFTDTASSPFAASIARIAAAGITRGCNPPANNRYCPEDYITRGEMATFLQRALELPAAAAPSGFTDVADSVHLAAIEALAASGITKGCDPPDNTRFCPRQAVTRGQMATFLVRALPELDFIEPPPLPPIQRVSRFTTYHDCCQPRVHNIQLMARSVDGHVVYPGEVFSLNEFTGPRTTAKGYVEAPILCSTGYCMGVGGGTSQFGTTFFNAIFWGGYEEIAHRPHSIWITRYPVGIEATLLYPSLDVAFRNDTVTPVTIHTSYTSTSITVELWGNAGGWQMSGYHRRGSKSSVIDVIDDGGSGGRQVEGRVYGTVSASEGGYVRVERTIEQNGESRTEDWGWYYQDG